MKLKTVELKNFRCYQDNDFNFGEECTIIIGKNGTGKSSLLSALRKGMTFIFTNTGRNKLITNNGNKVEGLEDWDTRFVDNGEGYVWPVDIKYGISYENHDLSWHFLKDKYKGKLQSKYYKEAQKKFEEFHLGQSKRLPLLGFYGDCYPHKKKDNNAIINGFNEILTRATTIPRDAGYFLWNSDGSIVSSWFLRTKYILNEISQDTETAADIEKAIAQLHKRKIDNGHVDSLNLESQIAANKSRLKLIEERWETHTSKFEEEFDFVKHKLVSFFTKINKFDKDDLILIDIKKRRVEKRELLFFSFGTEDSFNEGVYNEISLPMGYQRLIHIVYDIAYRWYILNGKTESFDGLVLIDELELHLHPSLQQTVVERFMNTFPGMQFIITSHSPIILSNFHVDREKSKIIQLEKVDGNYVDDELENLYTMDYNSNLTEVMGVNMDDKELNTLVSAYNFLIGENNKDSAALYYNKIKEFFNGNIPDFFLEKMNK